MHFAYKNYPTKRHATERCVCHLVHVLAYQNYHTNRHGTERCMCNIRHVCISIPRGKRLNYVISCMSVLAYHTKRHATERCIYTIVHVSITIPRGMRQNAACVLPCTSVLAYQEACDWTLHLYYRARQYKHTKRHANERCMCTTMHVSISIPRDMRLNDACVLS